MSGLPGCIPSGYADSFLNINDSKKVQTMYEPTLPVSVPVSLGRWQDRGNAEALAVSVKTTARMLEISEKSVRRLIDRGLMKPSRALRVLRIPVAQIEKFLNDTL